MGKLTSDMGMVIGLALVPTILGIYTTMATVKIFLKISENGIIWHVRSF